MTAREVSERCGCAEKGWQADPECGGQVIEGDRSRLTAKDDVVSIDDSLRVALAVESGIDPNDPGFASPEIVKGFVRAMSEMGEDKSPGRGHPSRPERPISRARPATSRPIPKINTTRGIATATRMFRPWCATFISRPRTTGASKASCYKVRVPVRHLATKNAGQGLPGKLPVVIV